MKDLGRVDWMPRLNKWRAFQYDGTKDIKLGDFATQDEAYAALHDPKYYLTQKGNDAKAFETIEKEAGL